MGTGVTFGSQVAKPLRPKCASTGKSSRSLATSAKDPGWGNGDTSRDTNRKQARVN